MINFTPPLSRLVVFLCILMVALLFDARSALGQAECSLVSRSTDSDIAKSQINAVRTAAANAPSNVDIIVPVKFHVFLDDDGNYPSIAGTTVIDESYIESVLADTYWATSWK